MPRYDSYAGERECPLRVGCGRSWQFVIFGRATCYAWLKGRDPPEADQGAGGESLTMARAPMSRTVSRVKSIASCFLSAVALTYLSLVVPGRITEVCGNLGTPIYCSVLAYGFPLPFLADSQAISPVGSAARDPLSIAIGMDDLLWFRLGLAFMFWMLMVLISASAWRRWMRRRKTSVSTSA